MKGQKSVEKLSYCREWRMTELYRVGLETRVGKIDVEGGYCIRIEVANCGKIDIESGLYRVGGLLITDKLITDKLITAKLIT